MDLKANYDVLYILAKRKEELNNDELNALQDKNYMLIKEIRYRKSELNYISKLFTLKLLTDLEVS